MKLVFGHYLLILFVMIFLHVLEDFHLQGILAQLKQRDWWRTNAPSRLYREDYLIALITHSFEWAFLITLPWLVIAFITVDTGLITMLLLSYLLNTIFHGAVDDLKANQKRINLWTDQKYHYIQIIVTWVLLTISYVI